MQHSTAVLICVAATLGLAAAASAHNRTLEGGQRQKKLLSLFSVVQFPNDVCTTASTGIYGTCLTKSECSTAGGSISSNCAAGFGVCCLIQTSTCSSTISNNNTYITNPNYPSTYTPTSAGSCVFTINKATDDVCQVRLDFQTFTGFTVASATTGECTDYMTFAGQTGKAPPSICSTNTGYHMYAEIGASSSDTATVTMTYGGTTSKQFNIFVQQIECSAQWRAPTDCVQWYTGASGTVISYGWGGSQLLAGQDYKACVRDEVGYCSISWTPTSGTSIDSFAILNPAPAAAAIAEASTGVCTAAGSGLLIPDLSMDGITGNPAVFATLERWPGEFCGGIFGTDLAITDMTLTSTRKPFGLHLFTGSPITLVSPSTGFSLDYSQNVC